jgi:orotate phosphoribosyltransferase
MQDYQRAFVDFLLEAEALKIGEFTLKSGRTSPVFLNTGLLDTGSRLARLGNAYASTLLDRVGPDTFDTVFGPAYKGIPLSVATAMALAGHDIEKACLSDRKEAKAHGAEAASGNVGKRLLGRAPAPGTRYVMVDDVLTDGATKMEAVAFLREIDPTCTFAALLIVLDRQETKPDGSNAVAAFTEATGVAVTPIITLTEVVDYLVEKGAIGDEDLARCRAYWGEYGTDAAKAWAAGGAAV